MRNVCGIYYYGRLVVFNKQFIGLLFAGEAGRSWFGGQILR